MTDFSKNGIVFSGIVSWIEVQLDSQGFEIWKQLAEKHWLDQEVSAAKEALRAVSGDKLLTLYPDFNDKVQGSLVGHYPTRGRLRVDFESGTYIRYRNPQARRQPSEKRGSSFGGGD